MRLGDAATASLAASSARVAAAAAAVTCWHTSSKVWISPVCTTMSGLASAIVNSVQLLADDLQTGLLIGAAGLSVTSMGRRCSSGFGTGMVALALMHGAMLWPLWCQYLTSACWYLQHRQREACHIDTLHGDQYMRLR